MKYQISTNDKDDFYLAFHGADFYFTLWEFDQNVLREKIKYGQNYTDKEIELLEKIRDELYEIMSEHGIDFEHIS